MERRSARISSRLPSTSFGNHPSSTSNGNSSDDSKSPMAEDYYQHQHNHNHNHQSYHPSAQQLDFSAEPVHGQDLAERDVPLSLTAATTATVGAAVSLRTTTSSGVSPTAMDDCLDTDDVKPPAKRRKRQFLEDGAALSQSHSHPQQQHRPQASMESVQEECIFTTSVLRMRGVPLKAFETVPIFTSHFVQYHQEKEMDWNALKSSVTTLRAQHTALMHTKNRLSASLHSLEAQREKLCQEASSYNAYLHSVSLHLLPVLRRMVARWPVLADPPMAAPPQSPFALQQPAQVYDTLIAIMGVLSGSRPAVASTEQPTTTSATTATTMESSPHDTSAIVLEQQQPANTIVS